MLRCAPLLLIPAGLLIAPLWLDLARHTNPTDHATRSSPFIAACGLMTTLWLVLMLELTRRAERRIAQALPHRVSRGTAVPLRVMLGKVRTTFVVVALAVEVLMAGTWGWLMAGWVAWAFPVLLATNCSLVVLAITRAATRPTLAADPVSLAIDERLRSEDAFAAARTLVRS